MKVRIGIDVGGTFTDVVVIDGQSHELIGQLKLPTTHSAKEGVARGIVVALQRAMETFDLKPADVSFIAHSTTQATNALLEGDVAEVGVVGVGKGIEGWLARRATAVPPIELTASRKLIARHMFAGPANVDGVELEKALGELADNGVRVVVASEAFSVDETTREKRIAEKARAAGMLATTGHEVSSLYGLRVRTRTAVINAAILPKMIETAEMAESSVKSAGIRAPLSAGTDDFVDGEDAAEAVLRIACSKIAATIDELIAEYHLARDQVVLVGGDGGAASLVPFTAELMSLRSSIARNAEVISPIGVAMAMVRDTVERNIVDPSPDGILRVRREAAEAAIAAGALPDSIEVRVEVDKRRSLVRATAVGTTELRKRDAGQRELGAEEYRQSAARSMRMDLPLVKLAAETANYQVFTGEQQKRSLFGLLRSSRRMLRVVDRTGVVRLQRETALVSETTLARINEELARVVDQLTDYGDAGGAIPDIFILYGARIANFSGLAGLDQVTALVEVELRLLDPATKLVVIACPKQV